VRGPAPQLFLTGGAETHVRFANKRRIAALQLKYRTACRSRRLYSL
jgi:hypothetical protein